jgi:hypothetical protein
MIAFLTQMCDRMPPYCLVDRTAVMRDQTTVNNLIFLVNRHLLFAANALLVFLNRQSTRHYFYYFLLQQYIIADDVLPIFR